MVVAKAGTSLSVEGKVPRDPYIEFNMTVVDRSERLEET